MSKQQKEIHRYKSLLEAARRIGGVMDLNGLVDEILDLAQQVMQAETCSILLPEDDEGNLVLYSTSDKIRSLKSALRVPAGKGIAGEVFRTKKTVNVQDASQDPRHYDEVELKVGFVTRAMLTIPLLDGDRCLGVMQALNPIGRDVFGPECEEVFAAFGVLIVTTLLRLEAQKQEVERVRTQQEFHLARKIQESFLPPASRHFPSCRIYLRSFPARNVGGDFCFLHEVAPGTLLMGLGDVSGKGVPAALTMARATAMIKAMAPQLTGNFSDWLKRLNGQLCQDLTFGRFIGMTLMLADPAKGSLQLCAAGQFPPLHLTPGGWLPTALQSQPPFGILPSFDYQTTEFPLQPGEMWLLYSDGITEARGLFGMEFTEKRLLESLPIDQSGAKAFAVTVAVWQHFIGAAPQHDDASILLLDWRGPPPPTQTEMLCCPETLCSGRRFVEAWAKHAGFNDVTVAQIVTACDEAASNIFRHAYRGQPGPITLQAAVEDQCLVFQIADQARPIPREVIRKRDRKHLQPGGLGMVILTKTFDSVCREPRGNGNCLTLKKRLPD